MSIFKRNNRANNRDWSNQDRPTTEQQALQLVQTYMPFDRYSFVPIVSEAFRNRVFGQRKIIGSIAIANTFDETSNSASLAIYTVPPTGQTTKDFLNDAVEMLDGLVPDVQFSADLYTISRDYSRRSAAAIGGISLISGDDVRVMGLHVPTVLVTDPSLRYAHDLADMLGEHGQIEAASTSFTAALSDVALRQSL